MTGLGSLELLAWLGVWIDSLYVESLSSTRKGRPKMNTSLLRSSAIALLVGLAGVASAGTVVPTTGITPFNFTATDTTGPGSGDSATFLLTTTPTGTNTGVQFIDTNPPGGQDAGSIGDLLESAFGLGPTALTSVASCDACPTDPMVIDPTGNTTFDYLAVHMGGSELLFHFLSPVTSATIDLITGTLGGFSNWRAYSSPIPLPGAVWLFLSALGLFGLRRKFAGGSQAGSPTTA
jgi:hypothetical protein